MGLLKSALNVASGGLGSTIGSLSGALGVGANNLLSGLPFVGEGFAQQSQQDFNSAQAANQMAFQKMMSDTAHQREVKDLKAAGLNPILSSMGGSGASSPSGAMATSSVSSGGSSSAQMVRSMFNKEREQASKNIEATEATIEKTKQDTTTSKTIEAVNRQDEINMKKQAQILASTAKKAEADAKVVEATSKNEAKFQEKFGYLERISNAVGNFFGQFLGSAKTAVGIKNQIMDMNTDEITEKYRDGSKSGQLKRRVPKMK